MRKPPVGLKTRMQALPSMTKAPDQRWATDLCRVWTGRDGWALLALVIDCCSRELLGWHLSRSGRAKTAESALEQALIARYGCLGKVKHPFLLMSDNGLVLTSRSDTALVKCYGLQQEFITPYSPEQAGMVECVIRTLKAPPVRNPAARQPSDCGLDRLVQPSAPSPCAENEDPR